MTDAKSKMKSIEEWEKIFRKRVVYSLNPSEETALIMLEMQDEAFKAGYQKAIDELRSFKDERNSLRIPAQCMADWLEERESEGPSE